MTLAEISPFVVKFEGGITMICLIELLPVTKPQATKYRCSTVIIETRTAVLFCYHFLLLCASL